MDSRTPIPFGEAVFYGLAFVMGLVLVADFVVASFRGTAPDALVVGTFGTMMSLFAIVPPAFRRGTRRRDDD